MVGDTKKSQLSRLLFFIFGATIVGETGVTSLIVSEVGVTALSKLNFLNGVILFLLPTLFFSKIDTVNRGDFLKATLRVAFFGVLGLFSLYMVTALLKGSTLHTTVLLILYPFSYLLKTLLFLTFWTAAVDVNDSMEAKQTFPAIASWGFIGGLAGSVVSRGLLIPFPSEFIILFWALLYALTYVYTRRFYRYYADDLVPVEFLPDQEKTRIPLLRNIHQILNMPLVKNISNLYFATYITIFLMDYFFWMTTSRVYSDSEGLAGFQYTFYIIHSLITIVSLTRITPDLINEKGFTRVFLYLPRALLVGSSLYLFAVFLASGNTTSPLIFVLLLLLQVVRYTFFENFFSPIYQMFFAVIDAEKRGRAKTVIEGVIKPTAIMTSAVLLMLYSDNIWLILGTITISAWVMLHYGRKIRNTYINTLTTGATYKKNSINYNLYMNLAVNLGSTDIQGMIQIAEDYADYSTDIKRFIVRIFLHSKERDLEALVVDIARNERDYGVLKIIADQCGSLTDIPRARILKILLSSENSKVINAAFYSLYRANKLPGEYRELVWSRFIMAGSNEDKLYSALLIAQQSSGDRSWATSFFQSLLTPENTPGDMARGLMGLLELHSGEYEEKVIESIHLFSNAHLMYIVEKLLRRSSKIQIEKLLSLTEHLEESKRHIIINKLVEIPRDKVETLNRYITENPESFLNRGLVAMLREIREKQGRDADQEEWKSFYGIRTFTQKITERAYYKASAYYRIISECGPLPDRDVRHLLEEYLFNELLDAGNLLFDALVVLEGASYLINARREFSVYDSEDRAALIELIELLPQSSLKDILIPILEDSDWETFCEVGQRFFNVACETGSFLDTADTWYQKVAIFWHYTYFRDIPFARKGRSRISKLKYSDDSAVAEMSREFERLCQGEPMETEAFKIVEKVLFFKKCSIFADVQSRDLVHVAEKSRLMVYDTGDVISRQGDKAVHIFLIVSGRIRVITDYGKKSEVTLDIRSEGESYGESGALSRGIRIASAVAETPCTLYVLEYRDLRRIISRTPALAESFIRFMGGKVMDRELQRVIYKKKSPGKN
ncbi:MAG: cyclic nucleotide-binding domain-containing protein [Fibrobacterota bacterium]